MQPPEARHFAQHIETVCAHFQSALEGLEVDAVAVYAGVPHIAFLDDYHFPFKPNPLFAWWGPMAQPDSWILCEPGQRPRLVYVQPDDYWHAAPEDPQGFWAEPFDIQVVNTAEAARKALPQDLQRFAAIGQAVPEWGFGQVNPEPLIHRLHWRRAAKTEYELECMRHASRRASRAHRAAAAAFADGDSEYQIHLRYLAACGHAEKELPYNNIIALNEHAAILHYQHLDRTPPNQRRTFLIDAGADYAGYAADVTRTWVNGDGDFARLVEAMDDRQQQMVDRVRPGCRFGDLHADCHRHLAELLEEFELIHCSADDALETDLTSTFLPHGLGHLIGLQVHDVGGHLADDSGTLAPPPDRYPNLRTTRTLQENFVVTIEPGFYFIPMLLEKLRQSKHAGMLDWDRIDALTPYGGVRIEDNVVARAEGPENLTRDAFAELAA